MVKTAGIIRSVLYRSVKWKNIELAYKSPSHLIGLIEVLVFDTYRVNLLRPGDIVLDLGAGVGDFSIIASKHVGASGKVLALEPNPEDYRILKYNIERNSCSNIIPVNLGVGERRGHRLVSSWAKRNIDDVADLDADTLENVIGSVTGFEEVSFVKMDIEGLEIDVIATSIDTIRYARVISIELHRTKKKVDEILDKHGFLFRPFPRKMIFFNYIRGLLQHPQIVGRMSLTATLAYPQIIFEALRETLRKERLLCGAYVKRLPEQ